MPTENRLVLVVEDDVDTRSYHKVLLEDGGFSVLEAENGKEAIKIIAANDNKIDAIFSDILMPEMNGYEFCQILKEGNETQDLPFVFISALGSLEEKIKGYSYGADEYAIKPLEAKELKIKVDNLIRIRESRTELLKLVEESRHTTMQVMTLYSDMGYILEFYKKSVNANSLSELANLIFEVTEKYGLSCSLRIENLEQISNFGDKGEISPLEANVIEMIRLKDRYYSFGSRLAINFRQFTLFVKNMPIEDDTRCGSLRDSLAVLCNAIEARIDDLFSLEVDNKKNEIAIFIQTTLDNTQQTYGEIEKENVHAIQQLMDNMENSFIKLGLSDEQEELIRQVVETCMTRTNQSFQKGQKINSMFDSINEKLLEMSQMKK